MKKFVGTCCFATVLILSVAGIAQDDAKSCLGEIELQQVG
jgi:hypothetical protein